MRQKTPSYGGRKDKSIVRKARVHIQRQKPKAAFDAQAMSHLLRGSYEEACHAAYRSVQANPAHSITYVQLAAALAKLGRMEEAAAAAARVLELQPAFRYSRQFAA